MTEPAAPDRYRHTVRFIPDPSDPDNPIRSEPATAPDTWNVIIPTASADVALLCDTEAIAALRDALPPIGPDGP